MKLNGAAIRMAECVFDASAVLAILLSEPGRDIALHSAGSAAISTVTLAEVASKLVNDGQPMIEIQEVLNGFTFEVYAFDITEAFACAALLTWTRRAGLSLGDRACLSLAKRLGLPAVTADRAWSSVADDAGVEVRQIR